MDVNFRISLRFHRYNHNSLVIVAMKIQRISHNMFMKVLCMMLSWVIVYAPWACKQLHACPSMRVATPCLLIMHEPPRQRCTTSRLLATFDRHTRVIVVEHYEARSAYHSSRTRCRRHRVSSFVEVEDSLTFSSFHTLVILARRKNITGLTYIIVLWLLEHRSRARAALAILVHRYFPAFMLLQFFDTLEFPGRRTSR